MTAINLLPWRQTARDLKKRNYVICVACAASIILCGIILVNTSLNHKVVKADIKLTQATAVAKLTLPASPLTLYKLTALKMAGILKNKQKIWAILATPDHKLYRISNGDRVGKHLAIVEKITLNGVEVVEHSNGVRKKRWIRLTPRKPRS